MKSLFIFLLLVFCSSHVFSQTTKWFSVYAFLPSWKGSTIEFYSEGKLLDRRIIEKDVYHFTGVTERVKEGRILLKSPGANVHLPFFIEPGVIRIRDEGGRRLTAFDSPSNDDYLAHTKKTDSIVQLNKGMRYDAIISAKRELAAAYIKSHTGSPVSLKLLHEYFYLDQSADDHMYYTLFQLLSDELRAWPTAEKIKKEVLQRYATATGRKAPLLQLPDENGRLQPLYVDGVVTLVNFWASWCAPCRKEHPGLLRLFQTYGVRGFTIVSVSLDEDKEAWKASIRKERLVWRHVNSNRGWDSPIATIYGIKTIPANFLLDREGNIIAKNLSMENLESLLSGLIRLYAE